MSVLTIRAHKRYALRLPVELCSPNGDAASGLLIELSKQGARISNLGETGYVYGDEVMLTTDCGRELHGTVRWAHDGLAGIHLDAPLHAPQMSDFLTANRDAQQLEPRYGT